MNIKTPSQLWLGVFVCLGFAVAAEARCLPPAKLEAATVKTVVDGDTLRLTDGRLVRLIGVNTPEMARDDRPAQPFAETATAAVSKWLGHKVWLAPGEDTQDRYGRTLAAVYRERDYAHLGEYLLTRGLGWQVSVPPNLADVACLGAAEKKARKAKRGVWQQPEITTARSLTRSDTGFRRITGSVSRVAHTRHATWIELDDSLSLRISQRDLHYFDGLHLPSLVGRELTVRGWLIYRDKHSAKHPAHMMPLRHPAMLEAIEE